MQQTISKIDPTHKHDKWTKRKEVVFLGHLDFAHSVVHESSSEFKSSHLNPRAQKL